MARVLFEPCGFVGLILSAMAGARNDVLNTDLSIDAVFLGSISVINLDAAANTVPTAEVIDAVVAAMCNGASNPASAHEFGDRARAILNRGRDGVVSLLDGVLDDGVIFTSGCTEANNTVFAGIVASTIITSTVEHPSVLRSAERAALSGTTVLFVPVDRDGLVDMKKLRAMVASVHGPLLVSIQYANSETGVFQPIAAIAALLATRPQTTFHSDAAQAFGKLPIDLSLGVGPDVITVSGHKLHAPMGVGAIVVAERGVTLAPLLVGGDQERSLRAGTEAVPLIAGLGAACEARVDTMDDCVLRMSQLRDRLESGLRDVLPDVVLLDGATDRLPNISSVRFPGVDGMSLIAQLDSRGVAASQGSACSSRRPEPSHVLTAMGMSENEAFETVRFSISTLNTDAEIYKATSIIADSVKHLRSVSWAQA